MAPSKLVPLSLLALTALLLSLAAAQGPSPPPPPPPAVPGAPPPAVAPTPLPGTGSSCPTNPLSLVVCGNLLGGLIRVNLGLGTLVPGPGDAQCCPLLGGLADLDAAVCLCTAIGANVLGGIAALEVPLGLRLLLNFCNKPVTAGFTCAPPPAA